MTSIHLSSRCQLTSPEPLQKFVPVPLSRPYVPIITSTIATSNKELRDTILTGLEKVTQRILHIDACEATPDNAAERFLVAAWSFKKGDPFLTLAFFGNGSNSMW